ncbi:DEAD/DEAH box helicase family protein [Azonexus sp. IMCC34839]|uniref:type I restriction endonuclease subunit R n=1 Tax=Azonexus sp. IMCC34839 TaxID=3133695 RepID=UPI00399B760E
MNAQFLPATKEATALVEGGIVQSKNFEFLRNTRPDLAALGGFAEHYAFNDPASALSKLRLFAERVVELVYSTFSLPKPYQPNLNDLLNEDSFRSRVPSVVVTKLHALRMHGNKAVHANQGSTLTALAMAREAFDIGCWVYLTFDTGQAGSIAAFEQPSPPSDAKKLERDRQRLLSQIAAQEQQMQQLLAELANAKAQAQAVALTDAEQSILIASGHSACDQLQFDEETTRKRLIDAMLVAAGWNVGKAGASTDEVGQEVKISQPHNKAGVGFADYVLWDDNERPLAVIEVKRTSKDAEAGRTQAKLYADGLEQDKKHRPVIFYTNGFDIFLWDDSQKQTPRRLFGFYSKASLQYLHFQRSEKLALDSVSPKPEIAGRMYQLETIKRICDRFSQGYRKSLVVLATGTGKTRVAVSLCDVLSRARWAKRILFLCDRRELRKQADDVFKEYLPGEPRIHINANTAGDVTNRIYLATYPAMMQSYEMFDVGYFDLIIADESHRSIYNRYRDLFLYFDALQVGLTATPVKFIARNTFKLFSCEDGDPTSYFGYQEAITHTPRYLVPFEVYTHTTEFLRRGIKYNQLSPEQREQLENDEPDAQSIAYDDTEVDRAVFNKDTNRAILRNLMENGIKDASGAHPGKSIIFARNHNHAVLMQELFDEMYPQYGGDFCRVIDNYDTRAEQLIDDFKDPKHVLTIAISVDMLDTGIDVPEVVNLVFAKPVKSYVKFWQMIGRGTRLCPNLFGPGQDKEKFSIFDHWGNFAYFEESYREANPSTSKSLLQKLFEARLQLADTAIAAANSSAYDLAIKLMQADIAALPETTIAVREKWREVREVQRPDVLQALSASTRSSLLKDVAPLMQWRDTRNWEAAYQLDLLVSRMQVELLKKSAVFNDLRDDLMALVAQLPINVNAVRERLTAIEKVRSGDFWKAIVNQTDVSGLETVREELRGIMKHRVIGPTGGGKPRVLDITEDASKIEFARHIPKLEGTELVAYRQRVEQVLAALFDANPTLRKIRRGEAVSESDLGSLVSLVLTHHPDVNLAWLTEFYPDTAGDLATAIRTIVGMEPEIVAERFAEFFARHPQMDAKQQRFMALLQNHIAKFGVVTLDKLYESPFTQVSEEGPDGIFDNAAVEDLIVVIDAFRPESGQSINQ